MTGSTESTGTDSADGADDVTRRLRDYLKRATTDLRAARARLADVEYREHEPIAVVGMACRFPGGVRSPEDLWDAVDAGRDLIGPFPADRGWDLDGLYDTDPDHRGTTYSRHGGFLDDVASFDASFFGIAPREALTMDPQQRLLLETCWEAFERADIDPTGLRGSSTGVYLGATDHDYGTDLAVLPDGVEGQAMIGRSGAVSAGRVAYVLGLNGPVLTVDTMCSSSLVALHAGVTGLRRGECSLAVVAGTTVMSTPQGYVEFSRQRALSPDGRCRAFSADADGTGWAEGVGVLVVEPLSQAQRRGHRVLGVVRGTAINSDGASNGLTAPNAAAQRAVIEAALADARLGAHEVDAVEAHGTGTVLGDPIEANALLDTYGQARSADAPLWLGSLKSNMGHAASAAGVAGVIKTIMAMRHGRMPATLHADVPTDKVDWTAGAVRLLSEARDWTVTDRPRRAGVSAFGASGTNAHVVLEQAPDAGTVDAPDGPDADGTPEGTDDAEPTVPAFAPGSAVPWALSARDPEALRSQARRLEKWLAAGPDARPLDVGHRLAGRAVFEHRAVVVAGTGNDTGTGTGTGPDRAALAALVRGAEHPALVGSHGPAVHGDPVFVFPGQGAQWPDMAKGLLAASPVFAARMAECATALAPHLERDLVEMVTGPGDEWTERVDLVQPVLFATMVSLAALWRACGVSPSAVIGHSQGEVAAACVAGALSLDDAARVVALRSRTLRALSGRGGMLSVALSRDEVAERLEDAGDVDLSLAAVNGARSAVVSGADAELDALAARIEADGRRARRVPVDYASHSAHVEAVRDELAELLAPVAPQAATVPFYSTVTGAAVDTRSLDGDYWYRNLRSTVEFDAGVRALLADGHTAFVEVSPHPVMVPAIGETADDEGRDTVVAVGTLRRDDGGADRMLASVAELWAAGAPVRWRDVFAGARTGPVDLPTYPFTRTRFWMADEAPAGPGPAAAAGPDDAGFWELVGAGDADALGAALGADPGPVAELLPALDAWRRRRDGIADGDGWRYRVGWTPVSEPPASPDGAWLLVLDSGADGIGRIADEVTAALDGHGVDLLSLDLADPAADGPPERSALAERLRGLTERDDLRGVVSLLGVDDRRSARHPGLPRGLAATTVLVQALGDAGVAAPLWTLTRGAVGTDPTGAPDPAQAAVWGLGRCAALEHPDRWGGLVDLPVEPLDDVAACRLAGALTGPNQEDQLAVRASGLFGRRLRRVPAGEGPGPDDDAWRPDGTVLVTGGTGGVGSQLARWLAGLGAPHLVLAGRRGADAPGVAELVEQLGVEGTTVTVVACDTGDRDALAAIRDRCATEDRPVRSVFHVAGAGVLETVDETGLDAVADTVHAKIAGAEALDAVFDDVRDLVLFSSISAVWGSGAHGAYAAGNAHLDALAERRRAAGRAGVSVVWGIWDPSEGGGMAENLVEQQLRDRGIPFMSPARSLDTLHRVLAAPRPVEVVSDVDWTRFAPVFTGARPSRLIETVPEAAAMLADEPADTEQAGDGLAERLSGLGPQERERVTQDVVRAEVAGALGFAGPSAVGPTRPFRDLGFDSLSAIELRRRLTEATGVRLPVTAVFDHPTVVALAAHVVTLAAPDPGDGAPEPDHTEPSDTTTDPPATAPSDIDDMDVESLMALALDR